MRLRSLQHACSELQRWQRRAFIRQFGSDRGVFGRAVTSALQYHRVQHGLLLAAGCHALAAIGQEPLSQFSRTCGGVRSESQREAELATEVSQTQGGVVAAGEAMTVAGLHEAVTQPAQQTG